MAEQGMLEESVWQVVASAASARAQHWSTRKEATVSSADGTGVFDDLAGNTEYLDFTTQLIDALLGSADSFTAAMDLRDISQQTLPENMPARDRLLLRAGGVASLGVPWMVGLAARRRLLSRLPGVFLALKLSGKLQALSEALRAHKDRGHTALVALYGDAVHGPTGGAAEVDRLMTLTRVPAVKYLAFDPARVVPEATDWSIDADLQLMATRLQPLLKAALEYGVRLIVEPRDTKWAKQLPELLVRALANPRFDRLEVGIALLAELPESWESYASIHRYARRRVADGGAPVEVIIGLTDTLARERAASIHAGLPVAVLEDPTERTAQLLRFAEIALHPSRAAVLRPVIATDNPLVAAAVIEAAAHLGAEKLYALQLRAGVKVQLAKHLATEDKSVLPEVRLRLPVTQRGEFGEISDYLVARIADAVAPEMPDVTEALRLADLPQSAPRRTQQRAREWDPTERDSALFYRAPDEPRPNDTGGLTAAVLGLSRGSTGEVMMEEVLPARSIPVRSRSGFANEPATDGTLEANREWARGLLRRAGELARHGDGLDETIALSQADLDPTAAAGAAREAAERWFELEHENRSVRLRRVALATAAARDRLITELATDTGAPIVALDDAVNHIIDAARYAGQLAGELRVVRGARFVPDRLVLVVADATAPLATQAASVLAVLGAGAGALWAVAPGMMRSATACVEEWEAGGLTPGAVRIVSVVGEHTFAALGASTDVDRAIVLGDQTLGRELARRRPDLRVEGHFRSRGSVVVTPSAERDRAISDIVASVFGGTETMLSQARSVILVGALARSREFRDGLADAVRGLRVGDSVRPGDADPLQFDIGPLSAPPTAAERAALSELGPGEEWLVQPEQLDEEGRLWSPGIRLGVAPGSPFWDDAAGLPVFGILTVSTLTDAIAHQNAVGSGALAGIQSWDEQEVLAWLSAIEAASLSVNRPTSGARIDRQPSGGWNEAVMGLPSLVGGPHWLLAQGSWELRTGKRSETLHLRGLTPEVVLLIEAAQPLLSYEDFDEVRRAALADQLAWQTSLGLIEDEVGLGVERNALRTQPVSVQVRLNEDGSLAALVRVLAAALLVRAPVTVSTGGVLPQAVADFLASQGIEVSLERDDAWLERLAVSGPAGPGGSVASRVRLIGGDRVRAAEWMGGLDRSALWAEPVTMAGPVELLSLLREQSVSVRAERHGLAEQAAGLDSLLN